ncbi:50S ribosomal protein L22 [Candidatus Wolfebacteria bacterium]|nr:50S ribosomal protein L22 [Candidatus Wolfebacteria bacterium]
MRTQTAQLNYLKMAPRKVRLVANALKGLSVSEAEARLLLMPQKAKEPLVKLLRSAVQNAKNNQGMEVQKLFIKAIQVDEGPMLKRFMPRAMGRATPIHKKSSHVFLRLEESEVLRPTRFKIEVRKKISKSKAKKMTAKTEKEKPEARREIKEAGKPVEKTGFIKRMFRRKSI